MPLLCLVELGLFLPSSCLFQCSPGLHFMCHLRKYSLYSPIHKSNSKNRSLSCRTTLNAALPFDRELLLPTFQLEFSSGLHPFHLHHALLACLSECHIKRIEKVKLWHLLLSLPSWGLLLCHRQGLDWWLCVYNKIMLTCSHPFLLLPVLQAVCYHRIIESCQLEKTSKLVKFKRQPKTTMPTDPLNHYSLRIFVLKELISDKRSITINTQLSSLKGGKYDATFICWKSNCPLEFLQENH